MENLNDRIKKIRLHPDINLSQRDFARRIDIGQSTLAMFETGDRIPKEIHVNRICTEFEINKDWLLTGKGGIKNMFIETDTIAKAFNHFGYIMGNASPQKKAVLAAMIEIIDCVPDNKWDYIIDTFRSAYETSTEVEKEC